MIPQNLTNIPSILPPPNVFKFTQPYAASSGKNRPVKESDVKERLNKRKEKFGFDMPVSAYANREAPPHFSPLISIDKK